MDSDRKIKGIQFEIFGREEIAKFKAELDEVDAKAAALATLAGVAAHVVREMKPTGD